MLKAIVNTFANCFKIPELKSRIWFTLIVLAICRLEAVVRIPGLDGDTLSKFFESHAGAGGGVMGMYSMFTGGALEHCAIGALGIMPYISATIIVQLLTAVVPTLSKMVREEGGRTQIIKYGRYLTVLLCLGQGLFMAIGWENPSKIFGEGIGQLVLYKPEYIWFYRLQTTLILTTGTMMLMWLGEQITDRGIGNGVSLVITIGILARLPQALVSLKDMFSSHGGMKAEFNLGHAALLLVLLVIVVGSVIAITQAQRKIPVQYAQRAVGRKVYSGGTSFMPLKVNYSGVMPIIFAQAILMFPQKFFEWGYSAMTNSKSAGIKYIADTFHWLAINLGDRSVLYLLIYGLMILFFSYFWVATQFNELQISDDLKKNGGYIPGVRPGQATCDYLHNSMSRITLAGAIFLTAIAIVPMLLTNSLKIPYAVASYFGGTSMLILVGVLLDTMRQMETHLMMRHYDGFLKKGRLKGRL
jgi:preprotein translocase subunit SecY